MTTKTEAQPEALRLAEWIDSDFDPSEMLEIGYDASAKELRRQHAEIEQLKAERDLRAVERDGANERVRLMLNAKNQWMDRAKAAEAQLSARQAAPDGWRLVPVEATRSMMAAAVISKEGNAVYKNLEARYLEQMEREHGDAYAAMLSAAPPPPEREPLKAQEVHGLCESAGYLTGDEAKADFINGLRHGEMAHGIGATND